MRTKTINKFQKVIRKGKAFLGATLMAASIFSGCENQSPIVMETTHYILEENESIDLCEDPSKVYTIRNNRPGELFGTPDMSLYKSGPFAYITNGTSELSNNLGEGSYSLRVRNEVRTLRGHYFEVCEIGDNSITVAFADNQLYVNKVACFPEQSGDYEVVRYGDYTVRLAKNRIMIEDSDGLTKQFEVEKNPISQEIAIVEENLSIWVLWPPLEISATCTTKSGGIGILSIVSFPHNMDEHEF